MFKLKGKAKDEQRQYPSLMNVDDGGGNQDSIQNSILINPPTSSVMLHHYITRVIRRG